MLLTRANTSTSSHAFCDLTLYLRKKMQVSLAWRGSESVFVKCGPTTRIRSFKLFRLNNVDFPFRISMSPAYEESYGAYAGAFRVRMIHTPSFPLNTPTRFVAGRAFTAKIVDLAISFLSAFRHG